MNIVIDENVSLGLIASLERLGHNVFAIAESSERGMDDQTVFELCRENKSLLITRDYHFTNPIRFPADKIKGIIYIRHGNLRSDEEIEILERFLAEFTPDSFSGKLVTLSKLNVKIR